MNSIINNALTQETPGKVFALLGVAMFSMAFMLGIAMSDASFSGQSPVAALPNPLALDNVVETIDNVAYGYSNFLSANLFQPLAMQMNLLGDNLAFVSDNSGLTYALGFSDSEGQVAGASIQKMESYIPAKNNNVLGGLYEALVK